MSDTGIYVKSGNLSLSHVNSNITKLALVKMMKLHHIKNDAVARLRSLGKNLSDTLSSQLPVTEAKKVKKEVPEDPLTKEIRDFAVGQLMASNRQARRKIMSHD